MAASERGLIRDHHDREPEPAEARKRLRSAGEILKVTQAADVIGTVSVDHAVPIEEDPTQADRLSGLLLGAAWYHSPQIGKSMLALSTTCLSIAPDVTPGNRDKMHAAMDLWNYSGAKVTFVPDTPGVSPYVFTINNSTNCGGVSLI